MSIQLLLQQFSEYSLYIKGHSRATLVTRQQVINNFCRFAQISDIQEVTSENVINYFYNDRINRKWSSTTFILFHKTLFLFFRFCIQEGFMTYNPIEDVETPKREKKLPTKLTQQEAMRILEVAGNNSGRTTFLTYRNHAIFATFIYTGVRKKELLNLNETDIDIENLSILIRNGKGSKDRIVPITSRLAELLQKYAEVRKKAYKTCPEFFTSYTYDMGFTGSGIKRLLAKIVKTSGIKFTLHKLRHTFATLMLEGGCDIFSLSKMMGHSDIKTTTIYLAASVQHLREQILKHPLN